MKKLYANILLSAFLFATMEVTLKFAGTGMDSFQLTFLRFMIGGLLMLPFARKEMKRREVSLGWKDCLFLLFLGILCIPACMLSFQLGIMRSNASTAAVLFCMNPFFTMLFAHFFSEEKLTARRVGMLAGGLCGLVFMIRPWDMQEGNTPIGALLMLLAAALFGLYSVFAKRSVAKIGIVPQTSISFIFGALVLLVVMVPLGKPVFLGVVEHLPLVLYVSIFVTGFGYLSYFTAMKLSDATTASFVFFVKPAIAPVIAVIVLHEVLLWNTFVGIGLILAASYLNIRDRRLSKQAEAERGESVGQQNDSGAH